MGVVRVRCLSRGFKRACMALGIFLARIITLLTYVQRD